MEFVPLNGTMDFKFVPCSTVSKKTLREFSDVEYDFYVLTALQVLSATWLLSARRSY